MIFSNYRLLVILVIGISDNALKFRQKSAPASTFDDFKHRNHKTQKSDNHAPLTMMSSSATAANAKRVLTDANTTTTAAKKPKKVKSITKKELNDKVRYASHSELSSLLKSVFEAYPQEFTEAFEFHTPGNMPLVPLPDDFLLKECLRCHSVENIFDFHGVKVCGPCHSKTLTRDQVMDLFDFTKSQADQIKRRVGNGMYGGVKYIYDLDTVVKAVKKRDGSLYSFLASSAGRSPQMTGDALKAATTKVKKNKVVSDALKYSDESSLQYYLKQLVTNIPDLLAANGGMVASFVPSKMPIKPAVNDPLLLQCFICRSSDDPLQDFYDIKVCASCDPNSGTHQGTLTRDRVMSYFHFTKSEADKITRKTSSGGRCGSLIYVYNVKTVAAAAKKKYGSLYNMLKTYSWKY